MGALTPPFLALAVRLGRVPPNGGGHTEPVNVVRSQEPAGLAPATSAPDLASILATPLDRFAHEGRLLEVRIPWFDVTVWFVPEERDAEALVRDGVSRGRIWTAKELIALNDRPGGERAARAGRRPPSLPGGPAAPARAALADRSDSDLPPQPCRVSMAPRLFTVCGENTGDAREISPA